jgi:hypothetical protein
MFVVGLALVIVASLLTPAPAASKVEGHMWRREDAATKPGQPWYQDYRLHSVALVAITLVVVVWGG